MSRESGARPSGEAGSGRRPPGPAQRRLFLGYLVVASALLALFFGLYALVPSWRDALVEEDRGIENATIVLFLAAFLVACAAIRRRGLARLPRGYALIGLVGLLATLEELSYGQRLFPDLRFPELSDGATFDALHDVNHVIALALDGAGVPWPIVLGLVGAAGLALAVLLREPLARLLRENLRADRVWLYMLFGVACMLVSIGIDTLSGPSRRLVLIEELAEMGAGTSVLFAALAGFVTGRSDRATG